jgi:hypothetical protein
MESDVAAWQARSPAWQDIQVALSSKGIWIYGDINRLLQELDDRESIPAEDVARIKALLLAVVEDRRTRLEASINKAIAEACGPLPPVE